MLIDSIFSCWNREQFRDVKLYPTLEKHWYQCSRTSTSAQVSKVFLDAETMQENFNMYNPDYRSCEYHSCFLSCSCSLFLKLQFPKLHHKDCTISRPNLLLCLPVVVMDEAGLPERSHESLKVC